MKYIIRLFKMTRPWYGFIVVSTVALFAAQAINLYTPEVIRRIIAMMESGLYLSGMDTVTRLALLLLALFAVRAVCQFLTGYMSHVASWRLVAKVRSDLYNHFQHLSMNFYHDKQTGELMSRVVNDTSTFESLIAHAIPDLVSNIVMLVGVLTILMVINPVLAALVCIPIPFLILMTLILKRIRRFFRIGQEKTAELNGILQDNFSGMREIQIFNKQVHEYERVELKAWEHAKALIRALFYSGILHPAVGFITSIGTVIVLIAGPLLAIRSGLMIADVVAFLLYLNLFYTPISQLTRIAEDVQMALAGAERVFEVIDTAPDIADRADAHEIAEVSGRLSFRNVSFGYKDDLTVLDNVSFDVAAGEMVAIVGPTGVGKTTISSLITRFYDPDDGQILIDDVDISTITLRSLRSHLSLVLQDVFLFNGTISENIAYGSENASKKQIEAAAAVACIDDYIDSLPEGYDTVIGERGVRLSGGQKQRVSIARSVLRNSPILVLDEATSSVDTETEQEIKKAINAIAGSRTLIVIAHRLSTIRQADKIIVLEEGRIVEQGSHEQLLEANGVYAKLCRIQDLN
ncbi:MAG: ABC transporter ATP-binding protein/permease [Lachnospiraceae bacterium]|jgi:ATP-binding cassette subfamily B protein|nr:ABC transporter ATP-binding protein/permease [Lachnospiraceae bacterium]